MDVKERHEDTDLCGLFSKESPFLAFTHPKDSPIGRGENHAIGRGSLSYGISEEVDQEEGNNREKNEDIGPLKPDREKGRQNRRNNKR